jgi:ABC-type antimicrobial peptide transport system permease subunit
LLTAGLAGLTLALASVGLYGVISRSVTQRTNEIGIRMALGATSNNIVALVLREGMTLAATGVAFGVAISYAGSRLLTALLFGITPTDAVSFALASGGLLLFAFVASYLPARRATEIDPAVSLRSE